MLERHPGLDPKAIDEVILGCANQAGEDNRNVARMAALLAGLPDSVPGVTVNRLCASGLEAVGQAARAILSGQADLVLAGGYNSCTFESCRAHRRFVRACSWPFVTPNYPNKNCHLWPPENWGVRQRLPESTTWVLLTQTYWR